MQEAARSLVGVHSLAAFAGSLPPGASSVRHIFCAEVARSGPLLLLRMEANAFLPQQVRRTAGALVQAGLGRMSLESFHALVQGAPAGSAGPPLPAHGLCLVQVRYPAPIFDRDDLLRPSLLWETLLISRGTSFSLTPVGVTPHEEQL
jgi:tRNA pseudouridine38-40 synthase